MLQRYFHNTVSRYAIEFFVSTFLPHDNKKTYAIIFLFFQKLLFICFFMQHLSYTK